ncbi:serine/threonine-protein kinase [Parafrankia sp. BMG5.11]|uniref:serine/threonine-protein kinase n=1 Tax=Parafrankia sp. BMG5.11 TaxID=222540 RepID=UPI001FB30A2D|nr:MULTISPECIES: serine/threonine-protein kinase [unclassified Parafrankia]
MDSLIGRGAMGEVWRGRSDDGTVFAFKVLRAELATDEELVARFLRERSILRRLDSPHTVRVHDLVAERGQLAIVMDLVDGSDLRREIRRRRTLAPLEAVTATSEILHGVGAAHELGIVHRDLKPENILMARGDTDAWRAMVTDFGIARLLDGSTSLTKLSGVLGTPHYMAPETIEAGRADTAADLYAVGVVLYELLCGVSPFADRPPIAALRAHVDLVPGRPPGIPEPLWDVVAGLLEKDPAQRPRTAQDTVRMLAAAAEGLEGLPPWPALDVPPAGTRVSGPAAAVLDTGPTRMGTRKYDSWEQLGPGDENPAAADPRPAADALAAPGPENEPARAADAAEGAAARAVSGADSGGGADPPYPRSQPGAGPEPASSPDPTSRSVPGPAPAPRPGHAHWPGASAAVPAAQWWQRSPAPHTPVPQYRHPAAGQAWSPAPGRPAGYVTWPHSPPRRPRSFWRRPVGILLLVLIVPFAGLVGLGVVLGAIDAVEERSSGPRDPAAALAENGSDDPNAEVTVHLADSRQLQVRGSVETGQATVGGVAQPRSLIINAVAYSYHEEPLKVGQVEFDLGRHFLRFQTTVGLADDATSSVKYLVEVHGDGRRLTEYTLGLGEAEQVDLDVTGILRLRLSTTLLGEEETVDSSYAYYRSSTVFGDARVIGRQGAVPPNPTATG